MCLKSLSGKLTTYNLLQASSRQAKLQGSGLEYVSTTKYMKDTSTVYLCPFVNQTHETSKILDILNLTQSVIAINGLSTANKTNLDIIPNTHSLVYIFSQQVSLF